MLGSILIAKVHTLHDKGKENRRERKGKQTGCERQTVLSPTPACSPGVSLDGEWGERESSQARVPVMRDDIDIWSRPRLAERLKVVGLRAHVAGDARPQQTRRGDDDGEEHHGGEERPGAAWARSSFRSGRGAARVFIDWFHIDLALRPRHGAIRSAAAG